MSTTIKYFTGVLAISLTYFIIGYILYNETEKVAMLTLITIVIFFIVIYVIYSILSLIFRKKKHRHRYCILGTIAVILLLNITQRAMDTRSWGYVHRDSGIFLKVPNKRWKTVDNDDSVQLAIQNRASVATVTILSLPNDTFESETYGDFINTNTNKQGSTEEYHFTSCEAINFDCIKTEQPILQDGTKYNIQVVFLKDNISTIIIFFITNDESKDRYRDDFTAMANSAKRITPAH